MGGSAGCLGSSTRQHQQETAQTSAASGNVHCTRYAAGSGLKTLTPLSPSYADTNCQSSCVGTASEWREKNELLGTLEAAIPYTERGAGGADVWPLQLRDNWTRHVPLGNMFSGLFVEIKEKTQAEKTA